MPKVKITNKSNNDVKRASKTFPAKEEREVNMSEFKLKQIKACKYLEFEYTDPLRNIDLDNLSDYTSLQLTEVAKELKVKNYSNMLKQDLIDAILVEAGIKEPEQEEEEDEEKEEQEEE